MLRASLTIALVALLSTSVGPESSRGKPDHVIRPFETVPLWPGYGPGVATEISGARLTASRELQVLVEGSYCGVPTKMDVVESKEAVHVTAYAAQFDDGPCPADIVPWFVPVSLDGPLAGRVLVSDATKIPVVDCATTPSERLCLEGT
jgi:hypothetical protein